MKERQIRELLHHANDKQIDRIAAFPATDEPTKERIYQKSQSLTDGLPSSAEENVETCQVTEETHAGWSRFVGIAAAFVLFAGSAAGMIYFLHNAPRNPQPELSAAAPVETESPAIVIEETEPVPTEAEALTKELIYYRCTTTMKYLTQLSGHIEIWDTGFESVRSGDILFDYDAQRFYGIVQEITLDTGRVVWSEERYISDGKSVQLCDTEDWDFTYVDGEPGHIDKSSALYYDGQIEVDRNNPRRDPTGFHELAQCFQPNDMTDGYLADMNAWDITGTENYQGRECAVIEGTNDDYGRRWNVTHFKIIVDIETGAWLFYEGYGDDETVNSYLYTKDMVFGDASVVVPGITEEEIDARIAAGYVISEDSTERRERILRELALKAQEQPTEETNLIISDYIEPETMPEPFDAGIVPDEFYHPCEPRFEDIPPELAALVTQEELDNWLASWTPLAQNAVTSVEEYPNKYTFVRDFGLTNEQVREALKDYIRAWDPEISLRDDEINAFTSGNATAMLQDFARWESIVVRDRIYTPKWMYEHSIEDYRNAGITPQQVQDHMLCYEGFDLTPEARTAFLEKLAYYVQQEC